MSGKEAVEVIGAWQWVSVGGQSLVPFSEIDDHPLLLVWSVKQYERREMFGAGRSLQRAVGQQPLGPCHYFREYRLGDWSGWHAFRVGSVGRDANGGNLSLSCAVLF